MNTVLAAASIVQPARIRQTARRTRILWLFAFSMIVVGSTLSIAAWLTPYLLPLATVMTLAGVILLRETAHLDLLQLGEAEARQLGVDVRRLKRRIVLAAAAVVGAGKSCLLRLLSGDLAACEGPIFCNEIPLKNITVEEQARLRSVTVQTTHVVFDFLVEEILHMGWVQGDRWGHGVMLDAMQEVMVECSITQLVGRTFNTLSGGEQQRVQFARPLLQIWQHAGSHEPRYLLLDEPTSSLDLAHELTALRLARRAADRGVGVLVVLHDLNLAARFADRIVLLADGAIVADGSPTEVLVTRTLSDIYRTNVHVERHAALDRLVVYS